MKVDIQSQKLPAIYKRNGKDCYLDPIRNRLVLVTPEETVRQKTISFLVSILGVPQEVILVEERLTHYGIDSPRRADIVIHKIGENGLMDAVAVIECKATSIGLDDSASNQLMDYCDLLSCDYGMTITEDDSLCIHYEADTNSYEVIDGFPCYKELLQGQHNKMPEWHMPKRIPLSELKQVLKDRREEFNFAIGKNTDDDIALCALHLFECLRDVEHSKSAKKYRTFKLLKDIELRFLKYGNASGGIHSGLYRSFIIEYKGNTEIVSIALSPYSTYAKRTIEKTVINVAIDSDKNSHHSLQLVMDDNVTFEGSSYVFRHHGRIGVSNKGSGRISELIDAAKQECPWIVDDKRFYLGALTNTSLWYLDSPEIDSLFENLVSYALVRDEYRKLLKAEK